MDFYDPQMLGVVVFGGFMLVSAIGIFLVSTFSMKETSYEEALAKQRKELEKASQQKVEKKKKEKPIEKKGKAKKKDEKPNGRLPELDQDASASVGSKDVNTELTPDAEPTVFESPVVVLSAPPVEKEKPALSPGDKKKKEKKGAKVEQASSLAVSSLPATVSQAPASKVIPKEEPVVAVPPVGVQQTSPLTNSESIKKPEVPQNQEELKQDVASKKKSVAKKKKESMTADIDCELYLPFKTLVSTIKNMVFGEGEAQQLIEILSEKAGGPQDIWHMATQKSDPVAVLKRQLEEKEKQLVMEQENATAAKTKLRELSKDVAAEKAKNLLVENKMKEQLLTHEQEITAVQARMQASYQDHVTETQQLQGKIRTLQEQLENGPNTQLARLQQENSILRDALNQATSQTESKQNAELAKLRQECSKLSKELTENGELLQQAEEQKKALEMRITSYEGQIFQLQLSQKEQESPLQKRLEEISEELCKSQVSCRSLQGELDQMKEQQSNLSELQSQLLSSKTELENKLEEVNSLGAKLSEAATKNLQSTEKIQVLEALLETSKAREVEKDQEVASQTENSLLQLRLQESMAQISTLEKETAELNNTVEQLKIKNNDLREKNWEAMEAVTSMEKAYQEKLLLSTGAKEALEQQLGAIQAQIRQVLSSLFPQVVSDGEQAYDEWLPQFKEKALEALQQRSTATEPDLELSLRESDEARHTLQAECDQYRTILAETERMLKDLQKSVEEEEQVWKAKLTASEEALQKSQNQMKSLEEEVEKFKVELQNTSKLKEYVSLLEAQLENHLVTANSESQNYTKKVDELEQLLSESQGQLDAAKAETLKLSQEFAQLKPQLDQTEANLHSERVLKESLVTQLEEAQTSLRSLQTELEKLRLEGNVTASATEDVLQLQERLEKEKKLSKDLGCAATKLKELLQVTQEQLAKERETVAKLQEQLQGRGETEESAKEGTSV
ncbi:ribosome-binding protein 1 [Sphaerodactylus townsendi]|nr:ribosome-binding protein 1 [Sphaerodactylus townsendi]XP_048371440.1 ribosome-binding protein 1 [Sphaerodactylus townsendi]XP_048371441.1 ribosome-binding protein 1 [Sphaerodactylus townsendi]